MIRMIWYTVSLRQRVWHTASVGMKPGHTAHQTLCGITAPCSANMHAHAHTQTHTQTYKLLLRERRAKVH